MIAQVQAPDTQALAQSELNAYIESQAIALDLERGSGRTYHWYVTVVHQTKGESGFYLDTTSDRFTDVVNAVTARRLDLGLVGYRFFEAIDLGDLPF
ncbi:hypothetical protein HY772_05630 [Candidatus Woesearchaeota archaeon]|nr:hypothetical protein [Candidatus Woesearchaeota archaeon]